MKNYVFIPLGGASDLSPNGGLSPTFGENTMNFYPGEEGYLINYPGKTDFFHRGLDHQDFPWKGVPPDLGPITRIFAFKDFLGSEHIVFVQGAWVYETYGNGYRKLVELTGASIGTLYYPHLFLHESKLVIVNFGDPPLIWDGVDGVEPVGVTEIPQAPDVDALVPPGCGDLIHYGPFAWANCWWPQTVPTSGTSGNADSEGAAIDGIYSWRHQFKDRYGNKGRAGGPSAQLFVPQQQNIEIAGGSAYIKKWYPTIDWMPPLSNPHVHSVQLGRTPNLTDDDPQGGIQAYNLFYDEFEFSGTTQCRHVSQMNDTVLLSLGLMDLTVGPPSTASMGCTWNKRIFLAGHQEDHVVSYSDLDQFGQFRATQVYRAAHRVEAVIPAGDRLLVITQSTVEVLYESQAGLAVLQMDFANGSKWGRSFVDVGGAVFGLWNEAFGFHDGQRVQFVSAPYWLQNFYQDANFRVVSAIKWRHFYLLSCSLYATSRSPNRLVIFDIAHKSWFTLDEDIHDLTLSDHGPLGVSDSIYELFKGRFPASTLELLNLTPPQSSFFESRTLSDSALLMWPSSKLPLLDAKITATGADEESVLRGAESLMPSVKRTLDRVAADPYWNKNGSLWADTKKWVVARDFLFQPSMSTYVNGIGHSVLWHFPQGHPVRLKAVRLKFSEDDNAQP